MAGARFTRLGTSNMVLPPEGPKVYPFTLDFTDKNTIEIDMMTQIEGGFISFVQSILFDNRLNDNPLEIVVDQINFPYSVPALSQGYLPLFVTDSAKLTFRTPQALSLVVPVVLSNTPVHPYIWTPI